MPELWEWGVILALSFAIAVYLSHLQWLSDDENFP